LPTPTHSQKAITVREYVDTAYPAIIKGFINGDLAFVKKYYNMNTIKHYARMVASRPVLDYYGYQMYTFVKSR